MTESEKIADILKTSPSVAILKAKNRDLLIPFLVKVFKEGESLVSLESIHSQLADYLAFLRAVEQDNSIDNYHSKARDYIREWAKEGFISNYENKNGEISYELSFHTSKTIDWLMSLQKQDFVGAESKFKDVFQKLKDLVEFTNEDVDKRIELLEDKKLKIEQEIRELKVGEKVKVYEDFEIIPRFKQLSQSAKELISDFKEVEENFKKITKKIYQKHANSQANKSNILDFAFDALDELKDSYQGKSFYAFWRFLVNQNLQEKWKDLVTELYATLEEKNIDTSDIFLKVMNRQHLYPAGEKVYKANDKMAAKLSQIIQEKDRSNNEITKNIVEEISNYLIQISNHSANTPQISMEIDTIPDINISFERKLTFNPREDIEYDNEITTAENDIRQSKGIQKVFSKNVIDREKLRTNIKNVLKTQSQTTIFEVIERSGGIQKGLAELFGYFGVLEDFEHSFDQKKEVEVVFDKKNNKSINVPEVIIVS